MYIEWIQREVVKCCKKKSSANVLENFSRRSPLSLHAVVCSLFITKPPFQLFSIDPYFDTGTLYGHRLGLVEKAVE
jgi:hypothetical protein